MSLWWKEKEVLVFEEWERSAVNGENDTITVAMGLNKCTTNLYYVGEFTY